MDTIDLEDIELVDEGQRREWDKRRAEVEEKASALLDRQRVAEQVLGHTVYEAHGGDASYREGCEVAFESVDEVVAELTVCGAELTELDEEIKEAISDLRKKNDQKSEPIEDLNTEEGVEEEACLRCGSKLHPEALFCMRCGASVEEMKKEAEAQGEDPAKFCSSCGSEVGEGDLFCMSCGSKLS